MYRIVIYQNHTPPEIYRVLDTFLIHTEGLTINITDPICQIIDKASGIN